MSPQAIDFSRSFLWWRVDTDKVPPGTITVPPPYALNNARAPLDCLCTMECDGTTRQFALGASCKTEAVGAEADIWPLPNADYIPVLSDDGQMLGIKTYDTAGRQLPLHVEGLGMQPERQVNLVAEVFESARVDVTRVDADPLETSQAAVDAILSNRRLVGQTEWQEGDTRIVIEHPYKTVNANERDVVFQPDTGPVLVPDTSLPPERWIEGLQLAFIAYNRFDRAELLIRDTVDVADGVTVWHYTTPRPLTTTNRVFALR